MDEASKNNEEVEVAEDVNMDDENAQDEELNPLEEAVIPEEQEHQLSAIVDMDQV